MRDEGGARGRQPAAGSQAKETIPVEERSLTLRPEMIWPLAIIVFLATVVVVNLAFIYVAVSGADEVAPSYITGER